MAAAAVCVRKGGILESPLTKISGRKRSCSEGYYLTVPTKKVCFRSGDYTFTVTDSGSVESIPQSNCDNDSLNYDSAFNVSHDPNNKSEWVDLIIKEMMSATSIDDAKSRASRLLDGVVEKFVPRAVASGVGAFAAEEGQSMQEKIEAISKENSVLKRAVVIQHQRQKKYEQDDQQLKELVKRYEDQVQRYEDQVKSLEIDNYGLTMHLQRALRSSATPSGFPPHVF